MNIFLTGGNGFLGSHFRRYLNLKCLNPIAPSSSECDLTEPTSLQNFNNLTYDRIYHFAAWTQAGDFCLKYPADQWVINQKINTNVLHWWRTHQPQAHLVFVGTSCVYSPTHKHEESGFIWEKPEYSLETYALTKKMLLQGASAIAKQDNLSFTCLVPSTLYGPNYHTDDRQLHFIFDLIRKILNGKEFGAPVNLWGDGNQHRELIHVKDFIELMWRLSTATNQVINIGTGKSFTIREFAEKICHIVGYDCNNISYDISKYTGATFKMLSNKKMSKFIKGYEFVDINTGLCETIEWYKSIRK